MVAVLLFDGCKIWKTIQADKKRNEQNGKNSCGPTVLYVIKLSETNCRY
jgi:hypothetical protein